MPKKSENLSGEVFSYFAKINVAAIKLSGSLSKGDKIHIQGHTTNLNQTLKSMQIDGKEIEHAKAGDSIGIKVQDRVRPGDKVFKA